MLAPCEMCRMLERIGWWWDGDGDWTVDNRKTPRCCSVGRGGISTDGSSIGISQTRGYTSLGESGGAGKPPSFTLYDLTGIHVSWVSCIPCGSAPTESRPAFPPRENVSRCSVIAMRGVSSWPCKISLVRSGPNVENELIAAAADAGVAGSGGEFDWRF